MALPHRCWTRRLTFLAVFLVFVTLNLLPLNIAPSDVPPPDLFLCFVGAWVIRRPSFLPTYLIAATSLLQELLLFHPPGLWTALVIAASEFLRANMHRARSLPFTFEWGLFALSYSLIAALYTLFLTLAFVPAPDIRTLALTVLLTCAAYPFVVAATNIVFRVRKGKPTEDGLVPGPN